MSGGLFTELLEADLPLESFMNDETCAVVFAEPFQGLEKLYQLPLASPEVCPRLPEGSNNYSEKEFHTLFEVGFRNILADRQRASKGTSASERGNSKSLSTISPAVFSLGYREVRIPEKDATALTNNCCVISGHERTNAVHPIHSDLHRVYT